MQPNSLNTAHSRFCLNKHSQKQNNKHIVNSNSTLDIFEKLPVLDRMSQIFFKQATDQNDASSSFLLMNYHLQEKRHNSFITLGNSILLMNYHQTTE